MQNLSLRSKREVYRGGESANESQLEHLPQFARLLRTLRCVDEEAPRTRPHVLSALSDAQCDAVAEVRALLEALTTEVVPASCTGEPALMRVQLWLAHGRAFVLARGARSAQRAHYLSLCHTERSPRGGQPVHHVYLSKALDDGLAEGVMHCWLRARGFEHSVCLLGELLCSERAGAQDSALSDRVAAQLRSETPERLCLFIQRTPKELCKLPVRRAQSTFSYPLVSCFVFRGPWNSGVDPVPSG